MTNNSAGPWILNRNRKTRYPGIMALNRIFLHLAAVLLFAGTASAPAQELSENGEVFLITCDPGEEVYSVFGHSAIWIRDTITGIDHVYNYGLFDFNTPNFYMKFIRGKLLYQLGRTTYRGFIREYIAAQRTVYVQKIYLNGGEREELFRILEINNQPENRDYLYDFFYDNCSSKIIDQFDAVLDDKSSIEHLSNSTGVSFRKSLKPYLAYKPWVFLGMDVTLGLPSDKIMTIRESMYLPFNLMQKLNDGYPPHLSGEPTVVFQGRENTAPLPWWTPARVLWLLSVLVILMSFVLKDGPVMRIFDGFLFTLTGLVGILVFFLWFLSDHQSTNYNFNLIWAFPLNLLFIARYSKKFRSWYDQYLKVYGIVLVMLLVSWAFLPQDLNEALIPVVILLAFRSLQCSGIWDRWTGKWFPKHSI
jgi:hypothetical protein